jgi:acyl-coenzyme A synthetase/AMP-(fatty) acid ligase
MSSSPLSRLFAEGQDPRRCVAICSGRDVDLAQFRGDVSENASELRANNSRRGLILCTDAYWAAVALFSLLHAHAVPVFPAALLEGSAEGYDVDIVIRDPKDDRADPGAASDGQYHLRRGSRDLSFVSELESASSYIHLHTSGSTGSPKRIQKSLRELDAEACSIEQAFSGLPAEAPVYATVPHYHLYGLTFRIAWPLSTGRAFASKQYGYWEDLVDDIRSRAVLITSPAHLTRIPAPLKIERQNLSLVLSAGSSLSDDSAEKAMDELGVFVTDILGSTETGVIALRQRKGRAEGWRCFPGVEVTRLSDGNMAVRSRHMDRPDEGHEWYETADEIVVGSDGTFSLKGRTDRVVKIEGNRIDLDGLEFRLADLSAVREAAVVALPTTPQSLGAVIVLSEDGANQLRQQGAFRFSSLLRQALGQKFQMSGLPKHWRFVEELPSSTLGKRREADLVALFSKQQGPKKHPVLKSLHRDERDVLIELFIPGNLAQLEGHFPDLPIVPGVAQIDWVVKFASEHLGIEIEAAQQFQIKFRRLMTAPSDIVLALYHCQDRRQLSFEYRQDADVVSSGTLNFR